MIRIEVDNSYSQLIGLQTTQFKQFKRLLSYTTNPQAAYFSGGFAHKKYLVDAKGYFPTGLLARVRAHLKASGLPYTQSDKRTRPKSRPELFKFDLGAIKPYADQLNAAAWATKAGRGGLQMPTGSGKSLTIALVIASHCVRTLVIVPSLEIRKQMEASLSLLFGANYNIAVRNIDSANLKDLTNFDCLIIDECHHSAAKTYHKLNKTAWKNIYYRFFFTATYFRNSSNEHLLFEAIAGQLIYKLSIRDAISKGYIVPIEAYYYDLPKRSVEGHTWAEVYSELVVNNDSRNLLISKLLLQLESNNISSLCMVKEVAHGKELSAITGVPFANGQDENSRQFISQFNEKRMPCLLGTIGVLGEGVDTKPCEYVILAGLGKAKSSIMQQIGRAVRTYPGKESAKVILIRDSNHKWTLNHFNTQRKILVDEFGITPIKLTLEDKCRENT